MPKPEKPHVEVGIIDYSAGEVITNKLNTEKLKSVKQLAYRTLVSNMLASKYVRVPLSDYDKALCFKPREWEQEQNYLDKLEDYLKNHCH